MSKIEWCDRSDWNPIRGCTRVSEGCRHCYAEQIAGRFSDEGAPFHGFATRAGREGRWTGKVELIEERLTLPLKWRKPAVVFVNSAFDLFHEALDVIDIARVYATAIVAHLMRGHVFVTLTKRAKRQRELLSLEEFWEHVNTFVDDMILEHIDPFDRRSDDARATAQEYGPSNPPPGIVAGVSVENQPAADERIPELLATPVAGRFVSAEPLLGVIDFSRFLDVDAVTGCADDGPFGSLNGVIVGGESGKGARPMHPDWARGVRDQCAAAGVPFFFKQHGEYLASVDREKGDPDWRFDYSCKYADRNDNRWVNLAGGRGFHGERFHVMRRVGKAAAGRLLDGRLHDDLPWRRA